MSDDSKTRQLAAVRLAFENWLRTAFLRVDILELILSFSRLILVSRLYIQSACDLPGTLEFQLCLEVEVIFCFLCGKSTN